MLLEAGPRCNYAGNFAEWQKNAGVIQDFGLAQAYANARSLRLADGPDEVHRNAIAKLELARYR